MPHELRTSLAFEASANAFDAVDASPGCPFPDFPLNDLGVLHSLPACKRECYWNPNCVGVLYDIKQHSCRLKGRFGKPMCHSRTLYVALARREPAMPPTSGDTCIVMWYTSDCTYCALSELHNRRYARRWGYRLLALHDELSSPQFAGPWPKHRAVLDGLSRCGSCFFIDADAVFNNFDTSIHDGWLAPASRVAASTVKPSIVISDDGTASSLCNTGVWWASAEANGHWASSWLMHLIAAGWDDRCQRWRRASLWEQSCWDYLLRHAGARGSDDVQNLTRGRMVVLNYTYACRGGHAPWPHCDCQRAFVLHFAADTLQNRQARLLRVLLRSGMNVLNQANDC